MANEESHNITKAVDLSKDRLLIQLKKYLSQLRNERSHSSIKEKEAPIHIEETINNF